MQFHHRTREAGKYIPASTIRREHCTRIGATEPLCETRPEVLPALGIPVNHHKPLISSILGAAGL